ncbi:hypothetical protein ACFV6F_35550, partial [Kitasatospora phosalacinea]|uniref:hypothetical protein n=1 Tax=Kitasatospora phosalacinea TaxID=2065 RepID=UPI00364F9D9E
MSGIGSGLGWVFLASSLLVVVTPGPDAALIAQIVLRTGRGGRAGRGGRGRRGGGGRPAGARRAGRGRGHREGARP